VPPRRPARVAIVSLLVCALCMLVALARPAQSHGSTRAEKLLLHAVNDVRANHGLRRLRIGASVQSGAHYWARYLLHHDTFRHGRLVVANAENIGWLTCRDGWARTLVRMWMNSYTHRIHLLDPNFRRIGVGVAGGSWSGWGCVRIGVNRFR
jgi:uncharacterized protein YkwD